MTASPTAKFTRGTAALSFSESLVVVDRQRSHFGSDAYLEMGVAYRALGLPARPKVELCHLRIRLDEILDAQAQADVRAWLVDGSETDRKGVAELLAFAEKLSEPDSVKEVRFTDPDMFGRFFLSKQARALFENNISR